MQLRFGLLGGGNGGNIGNAHRIGAGLDGMALLSAGCFSRNFEKSREAAALWNVPEERVYADYREMARREAEREDGIDFACIATPTDSHFAITKAFLENGIHVMCDKPLALTADEIRELEALTREKGLLLGVTYTYANYPIIEQARQMIDRGDIGNIIHVETEYIQDWAMQAADDPDSAYGGGWLFDPASTGGAGSTAHIGTHQEYLISRMTGLHIRRLMARMFAYPAKLPIETDAHVILELDGGVPGLLTCSISSIGHECDVRIHIFGDKGSLEWYHTDPTILRVTKRGGPMTLYSCNTEYLYEESRAVSRLPSGHPEGFYEAFANIYRNFCRTIAARKQGDKDSSFPFPTALDALRGQHFIDACQQSNQSDNQWVALPQE